MLYNVNARFIEGREAEFLSRLTDGSIEAQKPDGREIVRAMGEARIGGDGIIRWNETCYCPTPLRHERETVYDRFLTDIETEEITEPRPHEGISFMDWLRERAGK